MEQKTLYTVTIFSENTVGLLNQVTIIFTRRGLNIETLSVSPSALEGIHKFTITVFTDRDTIVKVVKQIDKRVDIIKAYFNTDEDLVHQEIALYKISTPKLMELGSIEDLVRRYNVRVLDMTPDWTALEKTGHHDETQALFDELKKITAYDNGARNGVLQFIRSGRIAITKSKVERLSDMLAAMEEKINPKKS
ncbi:MAG: acetolactate synthase small subunit [Dysgonamonadaceae bacterium]|jgi:acetolactate synthase-1/3 small subunit|nr:acetolactate synthase small subunit [Dysgonamonadaceae bacterium]